TTLHRAPDNFFRVAEAVDRGGIDPVDAAIESGVNGSDRFLVILRAPGKRPARTPHGPRADAERRDAQIAITKLSGLHENYGILRCPAALSARAIVAERQHHRALDRLSAERCGTKSPQASGVQCG